MDRRSFLKSLGIFIIGSQIPVDIQPVSVSNLFGIPYHQSNATTGTWLGIERSTYPMWSSKVVPASNRDIYQAIVDFVKSLGDNRNDGT